MQHTAQGIHAPGYFIALVGIKYQQGLLLFVETIMPRKVETKLVQMRGRASTISGQRMQ